MKYSKSSNNTFYSGLKQEVSQYFTDRNISMYGNKHIFIKGAILVGIYLLAYANIYREHTSYWPYLISYIIIGITGVMIVFNLVHDASHNAIFRKKRYNKYVCYFGDLVGINTYIWDIRHNVQHHTFTNILGGDLIIEHIPLIRLTPHQKYFKFHAFQVIYAPIFYMFYTLYWMFVIDFKLFFKKEICNLKNISHPRKEWLKLIFFKTFYILYIFVLPLLFTPLGFIELLGIFFLMHIAGSMLLSGVALLGHFVEGPSFPKENEEGVIDNSWSEHELEATIDFAPKSRITNWITGGLNTHIAHHLFPRMCHIHYYRITPIIRKYCQDNNFIYQSESLDKALGSHMRYLRKLSQPA